MYNPISPFKNIEHVTRVQDQLMVKVPVRVKRTQVKAMTQILRSVSRIRVITDITARARATFLNNSIPRIDTEHLKNK